MEAILKRFPHVSVKHYERVLELIEKLRLDGVEQLMMLSDFDSTLSKHTVNGVRVQNSYNVLEQAEQMPQEIREAMRQLTERFYPIEVDPTVSVEEKKHSMMEWWTRSQDYIVQTGYRGEELGGIVARSSACLRDGLRTLLQWLGSRRVPLFIVSGGVGDVINQLIDQQAGHFANIHTIANFMVFDTAGHLQSFTRPLIYTYSKRDVPFPPDGPLIKLRKNCLLLGDVVDDIDMAASARQSGRLQQCLTVGFLNDRIEQRRSQFEDSFDVVICEDETVDVVTALLEHIGSGGR